MLIVFVAGEDTQILDLAGPVEVFSRCSRIMTTAKRRRAPPCRLKIFGLRKEVTISTTSGLSIESNGHYSNLREKADTLLVVGGGEWNAGNSILRSFPG